MVKYIMVQRRNQITLPKEMVSENVKVYECSKKDNGSLVLTPQVTVPFSQAYFWTKRWQNGESKASEDIKSGRVTKYKNISNIFKDIEKKRKR